MAQYLDPKAYLTFSRVFGKHPDLTISFLNALLPLKEGEEIKEIEYLPTELYPKEAWKKNSMLDVQCKDIQGKRFQIKVQMIWSSEFTYRFLFNDNKKVYIQQMADELLQPVYSLNLVNEIYEPDMEEFYHYYTMVHEERTDKVIDGLHLIFVELPKFQPHTLKEKKMAVLWLRYLTEITDRTRQIPQELLDSPDVGKAVKILEKSAYTDAQLAGYEQFWDAVSVEKTIMISSERKGRAEGLAEGRAEGMQIGERRKQLEIAHKLKSMGLSVEEIMEGTGLTAEEIEQL